MKSVSLNDRSRAMYGAAFIVSLSISMLIIYCGFQFFLFRKTVIFFRNEIFGARVSFAERYCIQAASANRVKNRRALIGDDVRVVEEEEEEPRQVNYARIFPLAQNRIDSIDKVSRKTSALIHVAFASATEPARQALQL